MVVQKGDISLATMVVQKGDISLATMVVQNGPNNGDTKWVKNNGSKTDYVTSPVKESCSLPCLQSVNKTLV